MSIKSIFFIIALLAVGTAGAQAQDFMTTGITWTVDSLTDVKANAGYAYSCSFKTNGSADIQWVQQNGKFTSALLVQSESGSWPNVSLPGKMLATVTTEGRQGVITFERTATGLYITIDFSRESINPFLHRYHVTTVTPN